MDRFLPSVDLARAQSLSGAQADVRKMQPGKVLPFITLKKIVIHPDGIGVGSKKGEEGKKCKKYFLSFFPSLPLLLPLHNSFPGNRADFISVYGLIERG